MKQALKWFAAVLGVSVVLIGGWVAWKLTRPMTDFSATPMPAIAAVNDAEVIARGEYVAHALAHCSACHGPAEFISKHALSPDKQALQGGYEMNGGPFGRYYPVNLTSDVETGLGKRSDAEVARALRHGVDHAGKLAAMMSFSCGEMADEDLVAVVSYLRTLPPVKNATRPDELGPLALLLQDSFLPRMSAPPKYVPAGGVSKARGEYLANGPAHCHGCHTQLDPMNGMAQVLPRFSGEPMGEPDPTDAQYEFIAPNLTPDPATGVLAGWTEEAFIAKFRNGRDYPGSKMPWENFKQMTDDDLKSLWAYLRSLPPHRKDVGPSRRLAGSYRPKG